MRMILILVEKTSNLGTALKMYVHKKCCKINYCFYEINDPCEEKYWYTALISFHMNYELIIKQQFG